MATYGVQLRIGDMRQVVQSGLTKEKATELVNETNRRVSEFGNDHIMKAVVIIEMNQHEKVINRLIQNCVSELIGGFENILLDFDEESEEYKEAKDILNHDTLFDMFYNDIMAETKRNAKSHLRFAGKGFIEDRIEKALERNGYGK